MKGGIHKHTDAIGFSPMTRFTITIVAEAIIAPISGRIENLRAWAIEKPSYGRFTWNVDYIRSIFVVTLS